MEIRHSSSTARMNAVRLAASTRCRLGCQIGFMADSPTGITREISRRATNVGLGVSSGEPVAGLRDRRRLSTITRRAKPRLGIARAEVRGSSSGFRSKSPTSRPRGSRILRITGDCIGLPDRRLRNRHRIARRLRALDPNMARAPQTDFRLGAVQALDTSNVLTRS